MNKEIENAFEWIDSWEEQLNYWNDFLKNNALSDSGYEQIKELISNIERTIDGLYKRINDLSKEVGNDYFENGKIMRGTNHGN